MIDPAQMETMLRMMGSASGGQARDLELRAKQGRLTFAATLAAERDNCNCNACQLLRKAVELVVGDAQREVCGDATSVNPAP